jgi:hypothetical protein
VLRTSLDGEPLTRHVSTYTPGLRRKKMFD